MLPRGDRLTAHWEPDRLGCGNVHRALVADIAEVVETLCDSYQLPFHAHNRDRIGDGTDGRRRGQWATSTVCARVAGQPHQAVRVQQLSLGRNRSRRSVNFVAPNQVTLAGSRAAIAETTFKGHHYGESVRGKQQDGCHDLLGGPVW